MGMYYWGRDIATLHIRCARIPVLLLSTAVVGWITGRATQGVLVTGSTYCMCVVRVRERAERGAYHCIMRVTLELEPLH